MFKSKKTGYTAHEKSKLSSCVKMYAHGIIGYTR
jgi:hypothetical protein